MINPEFKILPWNGYQAAISLTFDDGDPSQLETAVPALAKRGLRGTFFLIANRLKSIEEWKNAILTGQEIGNHTLDHKHGWALSPAEAIEQIVASRQKLEDLLGVSTPTFAYPFTEITPNLRQTAEKNHFLSRGGYGSVYMHAQSQPDWHYLASQVAFSHTSSGILKGWTDQNIYNRTWSIPQFHAFTGSQAGWQPLSPVKFDDFLNDLVEKKDQIWIGTLGEVGAYWQAQDLLENTPGKPENGTLVWNWKKPDLMPEGTKLKIKVSGNQKIYQKSKLLEPNQNGIYTIAFDDEELKIS
jgi:hypothetical protein